LKFAALATPVEEFYPDIEKCQDF